METKWTPGPWKRRDGAEWIVDAARGCGRVASVGLGRDEADANAHLIASAPDLYAALEYYAKQFCEGFCDQLPEAGTYHVSMDDQCSGCKARADLAKARGEA